MKKKKNYNVKNQLISVLIFIIFVLIMYYINPSEDSKVNVANNINSNEISNNITVNNEIIQNENTIDKNNIPNYSGKIYIEVNNNIPYFTDSDYTTEPFEKYSQLDSLGRCGVAFANVCKEIMPKQNDKRQSISDIHPSGWKQTKFEGEYLYNRCHLIAYSLSNENANERNLITGTRYFNTEGMLPFETKIINYIKENLNNHVLYRVTPIFEGNNLVVTGVEMEAYSVEDSGKGVCFNVFVYNVQPGANIDYSTGKLIK